MCPRQRYQPSNPPGSGFEIQKGLHPKIFLVFFLFFFRKLFSFLWMAPKDFLAGFPKAHYSLTELAPCFITRDARDTETLTQEDYTPRKVSSYPIMCGLPVVRLSICKGLCADKPESLPWKMVTFSPFPAFFCSDPNKKPIALFPPAPPPRPFFKFLPPKIWAF